jgi:hypothetical protein
MKLLCKVTSRSRPSELIKCIDSYINLADNPNELIWLFTFDEVDLKYNTQLFIQMLHKKIYTPVIVFGNSKSKIDAINRDVNDCHLNWDILVNISDDQLAERKGWDTIIKDAMPEHLDASLWFNDGWQDRINTMEIVGREYYNRFKYIYHPEYKSFYCDNEATEVAIQLGKCIKSKECIIRHYHYACTNSTHMKKDETYIKAEQHWNYDKELYKQRKAINYGL